MWDDEEIHINLKHAYKFFVHVEVKIVGRVSCLLTTVYASPKENIRKFLWATSDERWVEGPWILVGDFNCVLRGEESSSGTGASYSFAE